MVTSSNLPQLRIAGRPYPLQPKSDSPIPVSDLDLRLSRLGRGERLINWSRVAISVFALIAVLLDPAEPSHLAHLAELLLLAYVVLSLVIAFVFAVSTRPRPYLRVAIHAFDLGIAAAVNSLTGVHGPLFVLFVFVLVSATLRWHWRGALWTGAAVTVAFIALGLYGHIGVGDAPFELNRFLIRGMSLAVVAVLLGYLGTWEERLRRDLVDLADFPRRRHDTFEEAARESLSYAAGILRAPRVMLAWEDTEEPWLETLFWRNGDFQLERHDPGVLSPLVAEPLASSAFLGLDLSSDDPTILQAVEKGLRVWHGQPLQPELARRVAARSVLSVPVLGEGVSARLFAFDKPRLTSDDLVVGLILGRQIVAVLEQHALVRETEVTAANEERMRLARELHDGIAQSLTGAALQLGGLRRTVTSNPEAAEARLDELERLLVNEHRELRLFMQELRPSSAMGEPGGLRRRLRELCNRVSSLWGVEVELEVKGEIAAREAWEVYRLVQEALVNAARHALASSIEVEAATRPEGVVLRITDDGRGFPFQGVYDLATLNAQRIGPVSLKERVASLHGNLVLRTSNRGTVVEISLPVRPYEVAT
jgi:signal transduction histidine kinase